MTDLEIIRDPEDLSDAVKEQPRNARSFSLLKWSKENRDYLFSHPLKIDVTCGLCMIYFPCCDNCPLMSEHLRCFELSSFELAKANAHSGNREEFEKQADLFLNWMKKKLNKVKRYNNRSKAK